MISSIHIMHPILCLYIDRLKGGKSEEIEGDFNPQELDLIDDSVRFKSSIHLQGEGYVADEELLFHFSAETEVELPCLICNEPVKYPINIKGIYKAFPIDEIKGGVCDIVPAIREEILVSLPSFVECCEGACPSRKELKQYLKAEGEGDVYHPFSGL